MKKRLVVRIQSCFVAIIFIVTAITPGAWGQGRTGGLPNLGDGEELSVSAERRLGQRVAREIYRDPDYLDDPVLADYLQGIWQPLLAAARERGEIPPDMDERYAWQPMLIRDRSVNAFALPGGYMGVHLGLIALVGSRDELASVMGHELTHITQRHIARMATRQSQQAPWVIAGMILGALAMGRSADAGNAALAGSQALAVQNQLNFSRDMEREADRIGYAVMTGAGFDGHGFASMFDKLQSANRINDNASFPYLRSHPLTTERIADAQLRATQAGEMARPASAPGTEALLMGARARVLADPGVDALRAWVAEATAASAQAAFRALPPGRRAAVLYAAVLAKMRLKEFAGTPALLAQLAALTPGDSAASHAVSLLAAEAALAVGDAQRALLLLPPGASSRAVILLAAQAQSQAGDAPALVQAASALQTRVAVHADDAVAWQLLATVYRQQGEPVRAIGAEAEARVAQLDYAAASDRLQAAQGVMRSQPRRGPADDIEASILDTRARQVALLFREQALER